VHGLRPIASIIRRNGHRALRDPRARALLFLDEPPEECVVTKTYSLALAISLVLPALPAAAQVDPAIRTSAACAPVAGDRPGGARRVIGSTSSRLKLSWGAGEQVVIDGGKEDGLQIGQRYYVRREMDFRQAPNAKDTIGWLQIVAVTDDTAIATIEFACDAIQVRDHLEPYTEPSLPIGIGRTNATGELDFSKTGRVLYGEHNHNSVAGRDFIIARIDDDQRAAPGARYAIYRDVHSGDIPLVRFGEAIVVSTFGNDRSLIRVTAARDAVTTGDILVARIGGTPDTLAEAAAGPGAGAGGGAAAGQRPGGGEGNVPGGGTAPGTGAGSGTARSITFEDVYFDFDRFTLRPEALALLDGAVKALADSPTQRILIEGHTCNIGTAEYNLALGQRRAGAVRDYLVSRGVAADRLSTVSYGEERPKFDNAKEETRRLNRRAVLTVNLQR
jgi:peptidoglycan-associated lipoprotein